MLEELLCTEDLVSDEAENATAPQVFVYCLKLAVVLLAL
jgi:hypothetical protein